MLLLWQSWGVCVRREKDEARPLVLSQLMERTGKKAVSWSCWELDHGQQAGSGRRI